MTPARIKISQSLEDIGDRKTTKSFKGESERLRTLISPVTDLKKSSGAANSVWTPRYGPVYSQHSQPLDYQHNVYIPGTPTMLSNKQRFFDDGDKNSFSTFGKKRKMASCCDVRDDNLYCKDVK